ncbi:hypothetical protein D3C75_537990 [compost metagenome]
MVQHNIPAVIVLDNLRLHISSGKIRRRIQVGQEADGWNIFVTVRRQGSHNIGMLVHRHFRKPQLLQFMDQLAGQLHLSGGGGAGIALFIRLGIYFSIRNKPLNQFILQIKSSPLHLTTCKYRILYT